MQLSNDVLNELTRPTNDAPSSCHCEGTLSLKPEILDMPIVRWRITRTCAALVVRRSITDVSLAACAAEGCVFHIIINGSIRYI